ncbi:hypothetical protein MLD38_013189 [Melastoma candidum]|uniref:Uncharacterized protein n=1 Tax=Melastoma candidum TaxID=119954 RepID=A0ACB9R9D7_9MYRT|nr:hypothetical protein MLD38_013189 [Melastoma candidum]
MKSRMRLEVFLRIIQTCSRSSRVQRLSERNLGAPYLRQMQVDKQNARRDRDYWEDMDRKQSDVDDRSLSMVLVTFLTNAKSASKVTDLLGKHEDLVDDFNEFLERCENIDGFLAGVINRKSLSIDGHISRTAPVEIKDEELRHDIEGAKERERCREKYWAKSIQELDLSDCQRLHSKLPAFTR